MICRVGTGRFRPLPVHADPASGASCRGVRAGLRREGRPDGLGVAVAVEHGDTWLPVIARQGVLGRRRVVRRGIADRSRLPDDPVHRRDEWLMARTYVESPLWVIVRLGGLARQRDPATPGVNAPPLCAFEKNGGAPPGHVRGNATGKTPEMQVVVPTREGPKPVTFVGAPT